MVHTIVNYLPKGINAPSPLKAILFALLGLMLLAGRPALAANVTVDAGQTFQTIDGFGVNANHRSWNNDELKPVLDALIDQAGMNLFRVVYDNADWETNNDNSDSSLINWAYFGPIYSSPEFQKFWDLMLYLNQKGITNGVMPNIQGLGPAWMGGQFLTGGLEGEWAELMTSVFMYARYSNHVAFNLIAPHNEPDLAGSGIGISNSVQYIATLKELGQRLDANGMGDVRFVGPDRIFDNVAWLTNILADATVMGKMGHLGVHSYSGFGGGTDGVDSIIKASAHPDRNFWVTEFGVWCEQCQSTWQGTNTWEYARATAEYVLYYLANNASGALEWEACDGIYLNNYNDDQHPSSWGLFALDDPNAAVKTYTPRKAFYTVSQISKFVRPGAQRINVTIDDSSQLLGFYHPVSGQLTLAGVNQSGSLKLISGTLTNLAGINSLDLYYTDASHNVTLSGPVAVVNGSFTATVPANSVFTLISPLVPNPVIQLTTNGVGQVTPDLSTKVLVRGKTYTLVAVPGSGQVFAGWTGDITSTNSRLMVTMESDLSLQANFVASSFTATKAAYNGLFYETDGAALQRSGFFTLTTTTKGSFSGRLQLGSSYSFSGSFDSGGHATIPVKRHGLSSLTLEIQVGLAGPTDGLTGTIGDGTWSAGISADRVVFDGRTAIAPQQGQYTMVIAGTPGVATQPGGDSYATVTVDKYGKARLSYYLADGTRASQSVPISGSGEFPLFLSLSSGREMMLGWLTIAPSLGGDLSGSITWNKTSISGAKFYAAGFSLKSSVIGSTYIRPAKGIQVVNLASAQVVLSGAGLGSDLTTAVTLDVNNRVTDPNKKLRMTISLSSGLVTGSEPNPDTKKTMPFGGVILQKQNVARGFFSNGNQTGTFLFSQPVVSGT